MGAVLASPAAGGSPLFGEKEQLVKLQDVEFKDLEGAPLYLGFKYSFHWFVAPAYLTDDGYILGVTGQNRYYPLNPTLIAELQGKGQLPKPLPPYRLTPVEYAFGYLLWIVLALFAVSLFLATRGHARARRALPFANEGIALERAGNVEHALAAYTRALQRDPRQIDVLCRRANLHHTSGNFDLAIADFTRALTHNPKNALALLGRGSAFEAKALTREAIADYTQAIKASDGALAYYARGNAHITAGDYGNAIADFTAVIAKEPQLATAYQNRGLAYERSGAEPQAKADYKIASVLAAAQQEASPKLSA
jgi:tetratricopeptide (TPR) repeat protein